MPPARSPTRSLFTESRSSSRLRSSLARPPHPNPNPDRTVNSDPDPNANCNWKARGEELKNSYRLPNGKLDLENFEPVVCMDTILQNKATNSNSNSNWGQG